MPRRVREQVDGSSPQAAPEDAGFVASRSPVLGCSSYWRAAIGGRRSEPLLSCGTTTAALLVLTAGQRYATRPAASADPASWLRMNPGAVAGAMPAKESPNMRPTVTAGLAIIWTTTLGIKVSHPRFLGWCRQTALAR